MTQLVDIFTFPWIKILFQDYLHNLGNNHVKDKQIEFNYQVNKKPKPFKAYIKEVGGFGLGADSSEVLIITDGFNEVSAKITPNCKEDI